MSAPILSFHSRSPSSRFPVRNRKPSARLRSMAERAPAIPPSPIHSASVRKSAKGALQRRLTSTPTTQSPQGKSDDEFWKTPGMRTLIKCYANADTLWRLRGNGYKAKDVHAGIAKSINNAHTTEGLQWTWMDVKVSIAYVRRQYKKARALMEEKLPGATKRSLQAQVMKICPEFDQLDAVLAGRRSVIKTRSGADNDHHVNVDSMDTTNNEEDPLGDLGEVDSAEENCSSSDVTVTNSDDIAPASEAQSIDMTDPRTGQIAAIMDTVQRIAEAQMQDQRLIAELLMQDGYKNLIQEREVKLEKREAALELREKEHYTQMMERDAAARRRLDEELAARRELFNLELSREKKEFYEDLLRRKEELKQEEQLVKDERDKYFMALAEAKILKMNVGRT
ncbi:hypothetical protein EMPS_04405 [Entomortierella parvispora]|uniref:Uncharacterized protein n=1 Tax=Entomortierella parvispora TaxID=205924 RepID=A0A9P3H945_9FUNG|nr:hypothetical protein EMPS_04405 [Entomortierella parvispora]